jgi:hypothetical protein
MSPPLVLLAIAVVGAIAFVVAGRRHDRLMLPGRPHVVRLELAGTGDRLHQQLTALGDDGRTNMRRALAVDRWIIAGYVLAAGGLSLLSIWAIRMAADGAAQTVGTVVAIVVAGSVVAAAVLDVIENDALDRALQAWSDPPPRESPANSANASARQAHRRAMITALAPPANLATAAARVKFAILLAVWPAWMVTVSTICVTHTLH